MVNTVIAPNNESELKEREDALLVEISIDRENGHRNNEGSLPPAVALDRVNGERERGRVLLEGFARLLGYTLLSPFLALRELYWMMDTDAAVRANGVEIEGTVRALKTETHTHTDPESGQVTTTREHFVTYRYDAPDGQYTARKKVESYGGLKEDSKIVVYYRQPTGRPVKEQDSALDSRPRRSR